MKFTKLAKSDKFEYMMLSRLIQDAKYFIEHPDLKHLWARTLDEHIKQMKEQYAKLDPKPEWISEEEINNLAKQMKESYTNHWNEVHPDNKIEAAIQQPNKPKPTTMLPDNMEWAWDPDAADWVAVLKDNDNTTPPLYDPNNQNAVNNTTTYMSNIKSASVIDGDEDEDPLWVRLNDLFLSDCSLVDSYIKNEINCDDIIDALNIEIKNKTEYKKVCDYIEEYIEENKEEYIEEDNYMSDIKSSCLSKFLDGPQYSKEIKIEAGLIKEGLVKYAGFDFNKGTKYTITDKGLEVLRKASEKEHNEALNEREKLAYMFGFNTDEVSTLDTTGKTIKSDKKLNTKSLINKLYNEIKKNKNNWEDVDDLLDYTHIDTKEEDEGIMVYVRTELSYDQMMELAEILNKVVQKFDSLSYFEPLQPGIMQAYIENKKSASLNKYAKKWTICEADGTELGEVEADSELDAKVKFGIEHPEYADSQSICAKEIKAGNKPFESTMGFYTYEVLWQDNDDKEGEFIEPIRFELCDDRDIDEWSWKCEELFGKEWFYGFLSRKDAMDKVIKELNKWGTIKGEIKQVDSLYTGRLKRLHSNYEQTTNTKEPYPNPSETPHDDIVLENHDGWVNTTAEYHYTPEQRRLLPLFKLVNEYVAKKQIQLTEDVQNEENTIATGSAEVINELEHKVKDLGFYCEPIAEITDNDDIGQDIYSLKIFTK